MLKAWGMAGKAMVLMLCVMVAAQSVGAFAAFVQGPQGCHEGHGAASAQPAQAQQHDQAAHEHGSDHHHGQALSEAEQHHAQPLSDAGDEGRPHNGAGCCGWLCSAATLPPFFMIRPAYISGVTVALPLAGTPENARPRGLFRPPRTSAHVIA
jgi:hypothetical protein